ncbi:MAG: dipeptidase [Acidobacteria bacterium]|nr:dipeptidase [Acidobacteriota bacterium]
MSKLISYYQANGDRFVEGLKDLLRIPSISALPAHKADVRRAADFIVDDLKRMGIETVKLIEGEGHPIIYAEKMDAPGKPTVVLYGHYDVQPPDPVDLWTSPPFEPVIKEGKVYARGASDDKGQVMMFVEAMRSYLATGCKLPCHVTLLIEGEEECGSVTLPNVLEKHADLLTADLCVVSDTAMWQAPGSDGTPTATPAITYALRGLVYFDVKLHGPSRDLHSGVYGGTLPNPATLLTRVLGKLFDDDNQITIPGFYDDVAPPEDSERAEWEQLGFDEKQYLGEVGAEPFGEKGFTTLERRWARPSCDVNGIYGGDMGKGAKTVIPAFAGAKVSFRIPANMDPRKVSTSFEKWVRGHDVGNCRWELTNHGEAHPVATPTDSTWVHRASKAIEHVTGKPPVLVRDGATIPVIADFKTQLKLDTLLIGFGLNSDAIHSPNEHFGLDRFLLGCKCHAALLASLGSESGM